MILLAYCWVWYLTTRALHWLVMWTIYPREMMMERMGQ